VVVAPWCARWTSGQRPRMVDVRRGDGLGIHGWHMLHEAEQLLAWLGDCLVFPVRQGCQLGRCCLRGGNLTFRPGRRPQMLVRRPWSMSSFPHAAWAASG
jgi:hypothetical protein